MVDLSLYIHVPFCTRKCDYCHFYVVPHKPEFVEIYLVALEREIVRAKEILSTQRIVSLYLGGGTPSLLTAQELERILAPLRPYLKGPIEVTLEGNPESITLEKAIEWKALGVNRVSIGVQSLQDQELVLLSRQHASSAAEQAVYAVYDAGIENISIDLIYDLPTQTEIAFKKTLVKATTLPITHLSLYNLTIEPHTVFYKKRKKLEPLLPNDQLSLALLESAESHLEKEGFLRYEISAFAKEGKESLHNCGYWTGRDYLGFGPGAHSFMKGVRYANVRNLHRWAQALKEGHAAQEFSEQLSPEAALRERMAIGLRLFKGIALTAEMHFPELTYLQAQGLLELHDHRALLTKKGRLFYDFVAETFII